MSPSQIDLSFDVTLAGVAQQLQVHAEGTGLDSARIQGELRFLLDACAFADAEDLLLGLGRYLALPPAEDVPRKVDVAQLSLRSQDGQLLAERAFRRKEERFLIEKKPFGRVDVVRDGAHAGIYRLRVAPRQGIPLHVHRVMEEWELVLSDGLLLQLHPVQAGTARRWPHDLAHRYDNPTGIEHSVLCVDRPRFAPEDEIEVPAPEGDLPTVEAQRYFGTAK